MAASPYPVASPLTQEDFNYLEAASRPAMPLSLEDMTSSYELFKTLKKEGAFKGNVAKAEGVIDTGVEAGKMIWEGGSHLLSDIFSWDEDEGGNVTALGMLPYWGRDAFRRVTGGRTNQQIAEAEATAQQTGGNVLLNWKHLKAGGGRVIDRMMEDDDSEEDLQSSYKYWKRVAELEKQRAGVAVEYAKDDDWKTAGMQPEIVELMASGKATPDQKAAMGGSLIMDPINWIPFGVATKALGVGGRGTLTGANRALIQDTLKMISQQRALEQVVKAAPGSVQGWRVGGRAGLQAGREAVRAGEAIQVLERKIAENAVKLAPIAKKRDIGLRAFAEGLEEGSPARLMIENALEGVPIKSSAPLAATVVGGATVAAGKTAENIGSVLDFLSTIAPETAITLLGKFGMSEIDAVSLMSGSASKWGMRGAAGAGAFALLGADEDDVLLAMATALGPAFLSRYGRDMALAGREMMKAEQYLPYFRRLRSPNPERLIDQAIDRTTLGSTYGSSFRRSYGAAEGGLKRRAFGLTDETGAIGRLGPGSAALARFLDDSKLGRVAETGGRIGAATIPAAGIGAGFGYVAGGGEDIDPTLQGLGMGLTLGMGGAAFGHFRRFDNPAQLVKARYGDWLHFKDNYLPAGQKEAYFKMPREKQLAMASMQLRHPDLVMHFENKGKDGSPGHHYVEDQTSHIAINVDSPRALEFVLSHEIIHDIDKRGGMQKFDDILLGNPLTEQPGVYTERVTPETKSKYPDLEIGEPILIGEAGSPTNPRRYKTNSDFEALRKDYGEQIGATEGAEGVVMTDHRTVREIVGEHGPDFLLKDKRRYRDLHEGPLGAMMRTLMETELVQNRPLLKNLIGILGGGFRPEGPLMADNAIFRKLRRTPAVTELIRKYNRKLEGLDPETRAKKFPLPESENTFEVKGADFAKHPGLQDLLRAGTFFRVNQDGTLSTSHAMTPRERNKYDKSFSEALKAAIEAADAKGELSAGHVRPSAKVDGKFEGTFLSDKVIDVVEQAGGWNKEQIGLLRDLNEKLKSGEGNEFLISYFKATTKGGRKYVNAKVEHLTEVPYGIEITKAGNINFRTVSIDQLVKNVEKLVRTQKAEVSRLYGSDEALAKDLILDDLDTYHRNHAAGRPGATGLHADPQTAEARRNLLNSAFGEGRKGQLDANPWLAGLTGSKATRPVYRSRRIERIGKVVQLSGKRPISYEKIAENFMPRRRSPDDTIPLPFPELPGDIPGEGFARMVDVGKTKSELAEAARLADEQKGWRAGNVRTPDAYGRDKLFMPAAEAGAPKGKEKWSAEQWRKKGTDSPFFRAWFGKSKTLEYQGTGGKTPLPWIHHGSLGQGGPESMIPGTPSRGGGFIRAIWLSQPNPRGDAGKVPTGHADRGPMTLLYARANKIWDWRNDAHLNALAKRLSAEAEKNNFKWDAENWKTIVRDESGSAAHLNDFVSDIKALGFDAAQIGDRGELVIFDAAKNVKSADNRGTFSPSEGNILFMPAESKGQQKKILLRTKQEMSDAVDSLAAQRGISRNDALNELLNSALLDPQRPVGKRSESDITLALTPEENALLEKTGIGPEESAEYKAAIAKRRAISEREIGVKNRLYMPADRALGLPDNIRDDVLPGIKQDKFSRAQLEAALLKSAGSKAYAEEIGLMDWLKDRKSVTKGEVDAFVAENAPRLLEYVRDDRRDMPSPKFSDSQEPGGTNYREIVVKLPVEALNKPELRKVAKLEQEAELHRVARKEAEAEGDRILSNEIAHEQSAINNRIENLKTGKTFKDDIHFGDNVLLWLRLNDRIDAGGKKVLFIEELQSNWHQKGRKEGYAKRGELGEIPDAPFKKNWPALGLKRTIREALENGYDRIAWLDGEGQAARYDLSRQVEAIAVPVVGSSSRSVRIDSKDGNSFKLNVDANGKVKGLYPAEQFTGKQLDEVIGKELAKKVMAFESPNSLTGLDLKVGGEGMKSFYDRELVSIANKISKKIGGGKVRRETIPSAPPLRTLPISHVLDLPKNPQAVENLRLYMPAQKAPSDSRVPTILRDLPAKGRGAGKAFMPAAKPESVSPNTVQSWDVDPSFPGKYTRGQAKSNDDVGKLFQEKYVEKYGEPIDPYDYTPETTGWLGGMLYDEAKVALARAGNAVDWYTKAVAEAMTIAEEIFPEIKTSAAAKDNFLGALAITSQNMRVLDNARAAVHQYDYKQKHGVFDYKKKHGGKAKMITENLRMFDEMESRMTDFSDFLDTDFTVKELTEFGQKFFGKEKFTIEGRINDQVKGSAVFGPKIGQGFFQNLKGNYLPVTIDLWLRRTFGRLTGRSVSIKLKRDDIGRLIYSHRKNKGKRKAKDFELPEFLEKLQITGGFTKDGRMNFKISESAFERLFGEHGQGMANAEIVFDLTKRLAKDWSREYSTTDRAVAKLKAELASRKKAGLPVKQTTARLEKAEAAKAKLLEEKPLWAFASSSISGKLKPIDIPTAQERTVIVDAFNVALKKLKAEGYDLTPADLQATLWYPEKDIWAFLKGDKAESLNLSYDKAMEIIRDERR